MTLKNQRKELDNESKLKRLRLQLEAVEKWIVENSTNDVDFERKWRERNQLRVKIYTLETVIENLKAGLPSHGDKVIGGGEMPRGLDNGFQKLGQ